MNAEEQKDWEDFIAWLDSEDAYKICFDSDTAHAIKLVARELKERREDEEWLKRSCGVASFGYDGVFVQTFSGGRVRQEAQADNLIDACRSAKNMRV